MNSTEPTVKLPGPCKSGADSDSLAPPKRGEGWGEGI
jgi:hypothetical protein